MSVLSSWSYRVGFDDGYSGIRFKSTKGMSKIKAIFSQQYLVNYMSNYQRGYRQGEYKRLTEEQKVLQKPITQKKSTRTKETRQTKGVNKEEKGKNLEYKKR